MSARTQPVLSVVVPVYNEAGGLPRFYESLTDVLQKLSVPYEIILVDDGSRDGTAELAAAIAAKDTAVQNVRFTRNFGKEMATTAGLHQARGKATIILDADGQHPVESIPEFVRLWQDGAKVVIGRRSGRRATFGKRWGARLFYGLFRRVTGVRIDPDTSDFRLVDQEVRTTFNRLTEHNRITRGLIDWLGYECEYVPYTENPRLHGTAVYSYRKLFRLAVDSTISLSISPLYITAYIGAVVLPLSTLLGLGMVGNYMLRDPLNLHATGGAYLMVLVLFLVGILLVSQGIIGLYLSHIHTETQGRPLYVRTGDPTDGPA